MNLQSIIKSFQIFPDPRNRPLYYAQIRCNRSWHKLYYHSTPPPYFQLLSTRYKTLQISMQIQTPS